MLLVNLLDWRKKRKKQLIYRITAYMISYIAILALILVGFWLWFSQKQASQQQLIETITPYSTQFNRHLAELEQQHRLILLETRRASLSFTPILEKITASLPENIWFNALKLEQNRLSIQGVTTDYLALLTFAEEPIQAEIASTSAIQHIHYQAENNTYLFSLSATYSALK